MGDGDAQGKAGKAAEGRFARRCFADGKRRYAAVWLAVSVCLAELFSLCCPGGGRALRSRLKDESACALCGEDAPDMIAYCRSNSAIGLVSLNDWYVVELFGEEQKKEADAPGGVLRQISTGGVKACLDFSSEEGGADLSLSFGKSFALDTEQLERRLCRSCLRKAEEVLRDKSEIGAQLPLCLMDFQSGELFSVQGAYRMYRIRGRAITVQRSGRHMELTVRLPQDG